MKFDAGTFVLIPAAELEQFLTETITQAVKSAVAEAAGSLRAEQEYFNAEGAANFLGVSAGMIKKTFENKRFKIGGATVYRRSDLLAIVAPFVPKPKEESPEVPPIRTNSEIRKNRNQGLQRLADKFERETNAIR